MKNFIVDLCDCETGAWSEIDIVRAAPDDYTAEQYIADCDAASDEDWCEMLHNNIVELREFEDYINVPNELEIVNLTKTGCEKAHIALCLNNTGMHDAIKYDYYDQRAQRGEVLLHTDNGDFTLKFRVENRWLTYAEII